MKGCVTRSREGSEKEHQKPPRDRLAPPLTQKVPLIPHSLTHSPEAVVAIVHRRSRRREETVVHSLLVPLTADTRDLFMSRHLPN